MKKMSNIKLLLNKNLIEMAGHDERDGGHAAAGGGVKKMSNTKLLLNTNLIEMAGHHERDGGHASAGGGARDGGNARFAAAHPPGWLSFCLALVYFVSSLVVSYCFLSFRA